MSQRYRAPVDVHPAPVPAELLTVGERLGRECLVRLDEVVVADLGARLPHEIADGEDRGEEEVLGVGGSGRIAGDSGEDWQAVRFRERLARDHGSRAAVIQARSVSGGDSEL